MVRQRFVEAVDHQPEARHRRGLVQQPEHPGHLDALVVPVIVGRPEGRAAAMRVQVHRYRLVTGHRRPAVVDAHRRGTFGLADRQAQPPGAARVDQHPGGLIGQVLPPIGHEFLDHPDRQLPEAEPQALLHLPVGQAHRRGLQPQGGDAVEPVQPGLHEPAIAGDHDALAVGHVRQRAEARSSHHGTGGEQGLVPGVHRVRHGASGSPSSWPNVVLVSTSTRSGKRLKRWFSMSRQNA